MGRPKGSTGIKWSNHVYKKKPEYNPEIKLPKDIEATTKEIFSRISYNAPWIMSPLRQESVDQLFKSVGNIIYRNK